VALRHPLVLAPQGPTARAALWDVILEAKGSDPLAPVSVAVPSPYAGLSLRRDLGRGAAFVNVRFLPLARVAELLGAPYLAQPERRPLTPAIALGAARVVLGELPGELEAVARHPATLRGLRSTFTELRELGDAELDRLGATSARAAALVERYRRFRALTADYYDDEDQLGAAAGVLEQSPALADLGTLIVYLPRSLSPGAETFVRALAAGERVAVVLGLSGDASVDAPTRQIAARLAPALGEPHERAAIDAPLHGTSSFGTEIASCPDADEEVRTVVRSVLERMVAGTPLHRIAVAYRLSEPYARILHEHFDAAGIPAHGPSPRRLADSAAGQLLLGLLALPDADYRREAVMELLTGLPVRETAGGARVPGPRWDRLSCAANIVTGVEQWQLRLGRHADWRRRALDARASASGALFSVDAADPILDDCERLASFMVELETRVTPPSEASWPALVEWALGLLNRYLGRVLPADAPASEQTAADRVRSVVAGLATLDALGAPASITALRSALDEELDTSIGHTGTFGDGVLVAPLGLLDGTDYDAVYIVGMTEGAFPPSSRDDPLLPDAEREQLGGALPRRADRRVQERAAYLAALAAAPWRGLSYPRADTRSMRVARPAPWLLETASAHEGRLVGAHELESGVTGSTWLRVVDSFDSAVRAAAEPASIQEHDLQWLLRWPDSKLRHPLVRAEPRLAAGLRAVRARTGHRLDAWDGVISGDLVVLPGIDAPLSPTSLETWAKCPFRYLLAQVLRVRAVERPEARDRIAPRERGSLVHAVLDAFLRAHPRTAPEQPWSSEERFALRAVAEMACDQAEQAGLTGRAVLWRLDRGRILRELDRVLDTDEAVRAERGLIPRDVEVGFGYPDDALPPVRLDLENGRTVLFRGRIDRVDEGRDGNLEVFDYKTGYIPDELSDEELTRDPVQGGEKLQLAIYGLAVREGEQSRQVQASYWYTREAGDLAVRGFTLDETAEDRIRYVLELVADEITAGHFPAYPGEDNWWSGPESCRGCDYDRLCPRDRVRRFERRRNEPALEGILSLRDPTVDGLDEAGG
jgi:ATP-dependent helicase/nuclease subunit B